MMSTEQKISARSRGRSPSSSSSLEQTATPTILIVDDDLDFLEILYSQISKIPDCDLFVAASCEEAVELLAEHDIQLMVCDWAIASHTGPDVCKLADPKIRNSLPKRAKIPVMFMSGSEKVGSTQNLRAFKNFEPVSFILKELGAPMIRVMAENILHRFYHLPPSATTSYLA